MNQNLSHVNRLEFAVTHTCNSNCKHCSAAGNRRSGCIDSHLAVQAVHEVSRQCKLESLMKMVSGLSIECGIQTIT